MIFHKLNEAKMKRKGFSQFHIFYDGYSYDVCNDEIKTTSDPKITDWLIKEVELNVVIN